MTALELRLKVLLIRAQPSISYLVRNCENLLTVFINIPRQPLARGGTRIPKPGRLLP